MDVIETQIENTVEVATTATVTETPAQAEVVTPEAVSQEVDLSQTENILDLEEVQYPQFTLAKNKARFLRMLTWYRSKRECIQLFQHQ